MNDKELEKSLKIDPLGVAEEYTGKNYKKDKGTSGLGMLLAIAKNKTNAKELESRNDSYYGMDLLEFVCIITDVGFKQIHKEEIPKSKREYTEETDHLYIFFREEKGQLLIFDSYKGKIVNGGNVYYNFQPSSPEFHYHTSNGSLSIVDKKLEKQADSLTIPPCPSGLGWEDFICTEKYMTYEQNSKDLRNKLYQQGEYIYEGHHDCREAILFNLSKLEEYGKFIYPWKVRVSVYELSDYSYSIRKVDNSDRRNRLPQDIINNLLLDKEQDNG